MVSPFRPGEPLWTEWSALRLGLLCSCGKVTHGGDHLSQPPELGGFHGPALNQVEDLFLCYVPTSPRRSHCRDSWSMLSPVVLQHRVIPICMKNPTSLLCLSIPLRALTSPSPSSYITFLTEHLMSTLQRRLSFVRMKRSRVEYPSWRTGFRAVIGIAPGSHPSPSLFSPPDCHFFLSSSSCGQ